MKRLFVAALVALVACSSSPPPVGEDAGTQASACTPDPAAIAAGRECRSDDQCPCGAHCALGACVAVCGGGGAACAAGETCDRFGRCRSGADETLVGEIPSKARSALALDRPALLAGAETDRAALVVRSVNAATGPIRATIAPPYRVRCGADSSWAQACTVSSLAANAETAIEVSVAPGQTASEPEPLRIFSGASVQYATVRARASGPATAFSAPAPGLYEGTLSLVAVGVGDDAAGAGAALAANGITAPARLAVFDGAPLVFELTDPLRVLSSEGRLVASASAATATVGAGLALPRFVMAEGAIAVGTTLEAVAEPEPTRVAYDPLTGSLAFELVLRVRGVTEGARVPVQRWAAVFARSPDAAVPTATPPLTAPAPLPAARALSPTAWHAQVMDLAPRWAASPRTNADYQQLLATSGDVQGDDSLLPECNEAACPRRLEACARPSAAITVPQALWNSTAARFWASADFTSATPVDVSVAAVGRPLADVLLRPVTSGVLGVSGARFTTDATDGVPCAVDFAPNATNTCLTGAVSYGRVDRCAELAARSGCEPVDVVGAGGPTFTVTGRVVLPRAAASCSADVTVTGAVTRLCVSSGRAPCGELVTCLSGGVATPLDRDGALHPRSGDLDCVPRSVDVTASVATRAERAAEAAAVRAGDIVTACLDDLARLAAPLPASATIEGLFAADAGCLDAARHLVALEYATDVDRRRALGLSTTVDLRDSRFAHRLTQQWLDVHTLMANEANQRLAVPDAALTGLSGLPALPAAAAVLDRALDGWSLVLHPRWASALAALPPEVLSAPDYRAPLRAVPAVADHTQPLGLPISMVRALEVQLGLTRSVLEDAARRGDRAALRTAGRMFRTASLVETLARATFERASAAATVARPLAWREAWGRALRAYQGARDAAVAAAVALEEGRNPLGVEESDLPLYFFGGETSPSARFSAVSDYLLGAGGDTSAWAPSLVTAASQAAGAMRTAYREQAVRQYQEALAGAAATDRLDALRAAAGQTLSTLCGLPTGLTPPEVLEGWRTATGRRFDGADCYRRVERAACVQAPLAALTLDDVKLHLCTTRMINSVSANIVRYPSDALNQLTRGSPVRGLSEAVVDAATALNRCAAEACPPEVGPGASCLRCMGPTIVVTPLVLEQRVGLDKVSDVTLSQAQDLCSAAYPAGRLSLDATLPRLGPDAAASARCLTGTLGELAMTVEAAATDIEIAREEAGAASDAYEIAMRSCFVQQAGDQAVSNELGRFNRKAKELAKVKFGLDSAAHVAGAVKDCASTAAGAEVTNPVSGGATAAACGAAAVEAALKIASDSIQLEMDERERDHAATLQSLMANTAFQVCTNDATMQLVGLRAATLRIQRASQDLGLALYRLDEGERAADEAFDAGTAALEDARGRSYRPPAIDGWVDASVASFQRAMRLARRMTYLSVRAVEYEFQSSLMARADVLAADTPEQLQQVIDGLRATAGTRRINGRAPSALKAVVSLRQHVLQLADRSQLAPSEQRLSEVALFRTRLKTRYLVTDSGGRASLRVPFALAPLGGARPGNPMGVPIFSTSDCAERVWSVNASILGTPRLYKGDSTTFTRVSLEKSNTFFSQWCGAPPVGAPPFQWASVRPSVNLFQDPVYGPGRIGTTALGGTLGVQSAVDATSRARIQAYFNVPRATFEADTYANGETAELAGRGLYGQYELVIPAEVISTGGSNGLDLDQVDDILLRLDYVSVANN